MSWRLWPVFPLVPWRWHLWLGALSALCRKNAGGSSICHWGHGRGARPDQHADQMEGGTHREFILGFACSISVTGTGALLAWAIVAERGSIAWVWLVLACLFVGTASNSSTRMQNDGHIRPRKTCWVKKIPMVNICSYGSQQYCAWGPPRENTNILRGSHRWHCREPLCRRGGGRRDVSRSGLDRSPLQAAGHCQGREVHGGLHPAGDSGAVVRW